MLIRCPECGREVSDKAPTCPHCGIQIAGHYAAQPASGGYNNYPPQPQTGVPSPEPQQPKKKSNWGVYLFSFLFAIAVCGVVLYFYHDAKANEEREQYEIALQSDNPEVLNGFLETYRDAPREHRDSIQAHLSRLNQIEREWNDALVSNSRAALQHYIDQYPSSENAKKATHMIDSIDFESAKRASSADALKSYIEGHPNGDFIEAANELIHGLSAMIVQPEEKQMISSIFRTFFQSINSKDDNRLISTVNSLLTTFLGKNDATKNDVVYFMQKLWKEDVMNLNWHIIDDYKIEKKEVGNGEYEFFVTFSATQDVQKATGMTENKFRIKAKVNPEGKISEFNMSKIVE